MTLHLLLIKSAVTLWQVYPSLQCYKVFYLICMVYTACVINLSFITQVMLYQTLPVRITFDTILRASLWSFFIITYFSGKNKPHTWLKSYTGSWLHILDWPIFSRIFWFKHTCFKLILVIVECSSDKWSNSFTHFLSQPWKP